MFITVVDEDGDFIGVYDSTKEEIKKQYVDYLKWFNEHSDEIEHDKIYGLMFNEWLEKVGIKEVKNEIVYLDDSDMDD